MVGGGQSRLLTDRVRSVYASQSSWVKGSSGEEEIATPQNGHSLKNTKSKCHKPPALTKNNKYNLNKNIHETLVFPCCFQHDFAKIIRRDTQYSSVLKRFEICSKTVSKIKHATPNFKRQSKSNPPLAQHKQK